MPTALVTNPNGDLYGASRMMLETVDGLLERGWRVVVTMPTPGPMVEALTARGCEVRPCPSPMLRKDLLGPRGVLSLLAGTARAVPAGLRLLRSVRPDACYVNTLTLPLWLLLARLARVPTVCHVHEAEPDAPRPVRLGLALPLLLARRLVANSRFSASVLAADVARLGRRCEVVPNGVAGPPSPPSPPRAELDPPMRLLYLGRLSERKGVRDAIDAVVLLRGRGTDVALDVVGAAVPGHDHVEADLRARAAAAGDGAVRFHGFDTAIWDHLAATDVLVVPSRLPEPFGNTAVEGVLAARPVVVAAHGGLVEAVEGYGSAVGVPPADPAAIAAAVEDLRARWGSVRSSTAADAAAAADRHSVVRYRTRMADVIAATAHPRRRRRRGGS